jgi:hypothetical protein
MSGGAELPQDVWAEEVGEHAVVCGTSNCKHDVSCVCPAATPCIERASTNAERMNASSHAVHDHVEVQGVPSTTQAALHCRSRRRAMLSPHRTSCSRSRPRGWQTLCSCSLWLTARCSPRYSCSNDVMMLQVLDCCWMITAQKAAECATPVFVITARALWYCQ